MGAHSHIVFRTLVRGGVLWVLMCLLLTASSCTEGEKSLCGDGTCDPEETAGSCPEDCGSRCGNGVADIEAGEFCDGPDLALHTCLDVNCGGGTLTCNNDCTLNRATCTDCRPLCGDGYAERPEEECDCGENPGNLPDGCSAVNGNPEGECKADCTWNAECGNGVREFPEECDCGRDWDTLNPACNSPNGPGSRCRPDCRIQETPHGEMWDPCDPQDPGSCWDTWMCELSLYCEWSAFPNPICMGACSATEECFYNMLCLTGPGYCFPAYCGPGPDNVIGGQLNEPCQVPGGGNGWCTPLRLAKDQLGICVEAGTQLPGEACTYYQHLDTTELCRDDPNTLVCDTGWCNTNNLACIGFCDPDDVYENDANSGYCPAGYNCWNYSYVDPFDPVEAGCRTSDFGLCLPTTATDPSGGMNACDLTNGQLIENRGLTCIDVNPLYECVLKVYSSNEISFGSRIGECADTIDATSAGLWDPCNPQSDICPAGSLCAVEDVFAATPLGPSRCIPFCDTDDATGCTAQHPEVPSGNSCTSVSNMFVGEPCQETNPSKLGLCACPPQGCQ